MFITALLGTTGWISNALCLVKKDINKIIVYYFKYIVDPEKGRLGANWTQIYNKQNKNKNKKKCLPVFLTQGPITQTVLQGETCTQLPAFCTELCSCTVVLPSEPALINEFLELYFNPIGLRLSPSPSSPTNQSGSILTNQDSVFWTKLWGFEVLIRMRMDQSGTRVMDICLSKSAPLWLWEFTLPFYWRLRCPG